MVETTYPPALSPPVHANQTLYITSHHSHLKVLFANVLRLGVTDRSVVGVVDIPFRLAPIG